MAISGKILGRGLAQPVGRASRGCLPVPYQTISPANTGQNVTIVRLNISRWQATVNDYLDLAAMGQITPDVPVRAQFAVDVLRKIAGNLELGVCCSMIATTIDDRFLGAMNYTPMSPTESTIGLLAVDPRNVPGSPDEPKYRGVGTSMVATLADMLLNQGVTTIYLHPKDAQAATFWRARGFASCGGGGLLCARDADKIRAMIDGCLRGADNPLDNHVTLCGLPAIVRERLLAGG